MIIYAIFIAIILLIFSLFSLITFLADIYAFRHFRFDLFSFHYAYISRHAAIDIFCRYIFINIDCCHYAAIDISLIFHADIYVFISHFSFSDYYYFYAWLAFFDIFIFCRIFMLMSRWWYLLIWFRFLTLRHDILSITPFSRFHYAAYALIIFIWLRFLHTPLIFSFILMLFYFFIAFHIISYIIFAPFISLAFINIFASPPFLFRWLLFLSFLSLFSFSSLYFISPSLYFIYLFHCYFSLLINISFFIYLLFIITPFHYLFTPAADIFAFASRCHMPLFSLLILYASLHHFIDAIMPVYLAIWLLSFSFCLLRHLYWCFWCLLIYAIIIYFMLLPLFDYAALIYYAAFHWLRHYLPMMPFWYFIYAAAHCWLRFLFLFHCRWYFRHFRHYHFSMPFHYDCHL